MNKREARREFKSRKSTKGIFAVRCTASREVWVGAHGDLPAARNGVFFLLRNGMHHNKQLQERWNKHGAESFAFEVLETFDEDISPLLLRDLFRERQKHWEKELGASAL